MEKYRETAEKKLKGVHPDQEAKEALVRASFASLEREEFFTDAFADVMVDLFIAWCNSDPHETKARESLYYTMVSLGHVKERLAQYEMRGKNLNHLGGQE